MNTAMNPAKQEIIKTGKWIMENHLTWGTSGNISARNGDGIYITASGTVLGALTEADILLCDPEGNVLEGDKKPSKETGMHLEVYQTCPDVNGIVHASPFYSTFCACSDIEIKRNLFIESMYYGASVRKIPYYHAGSRELAQAVSEVCGETHVILMEHHGILVYDKDLTECRTGLDVLEQLCRMNIVARIGGIQLNEVEARTVAEFLEGGYYKKRGV